MVGIVKNTVSRLEPQRAALSDRVSKEMSKAPSGDTLKGGDTVELKTADVPSSIKQMASSAPIDEANVNRIKEAIKRGEYPIDIERVSDALMEAYVELKS